MVGGCGLKVCQQRVKSRCVLVYQSLGWVWSEGVSVKDQDYWQRNV